MQRRKLRAFSPSTNSLPIVRQAFEYQHASGLSTKWIAHDMGAGRKLLDRWKMTNSVPNLFLFMCFLEAFGYELVIRKKEKKDGACASPSEE